MDRPPLLLLPGTLCTGDLFRQQVAALQGLAPSVEIVPFRLESSIAEMADTVLESMPDGLRFALAGFSMGGMVAMLLAARHPERVERLALLNTNTHADRPDRREARLKLVATAGEVGVAEIVARHYLPRYLYRQELEHQQLILQMAEELGPDCLRAQAEALANRENAAGRLGQVACPTLVLGASEDRLCPARGHFEMHRGIRNSDLVVLGACGHFSMLERPAAVNNALRGWYLAEP